MSTKSPPHEALPTPDSKRRADAADPAFILEDSPFFLMNQATGAYALAMEQALKAVGADIPRWRVLMLAHERGPISVGEIAALGMLKLPTATKVVQRLSLEGLLSVTRSTADGRVTEVTCTPDGTEMVAKVRVVASARFHEAFDTFSAAELDLLNGMLRRILSALTR